jgi:hypothetical protein
MLLSISYETYNLPSKKISFLEESLNITKYIINITRSTLEYIFITNTFGDTNIDIIYYKSSQI